MKIFEKLSFKNLFQIRYKKVLHRKLKEEKGEDGEEDLSREDLPLVDQSKEHEMYINPLQPLLKQM